MLLLISNSSAIFLSFKYLNTSNVTVNQLCSCCGSIKKDYLNTSNVTVNPNELAISSNSLSFKYI